MSNYDDLDAALNKLSKSLDQLQATIKEVREDVFGGERCQVCEMAAHDGYCISPQAKAWFASQGVQ
jgi:hypothetical protein